MTQLESGEPASMAQLMSIFSGQSQNEPAFTNVGTVLEDGNVAPGQAFKPKKRRVNEFGDQVSSESSAEEDVEAEVLPVEDEQSSSGSTQSFIQILFESQIKRKFEEE